MVEAKVKVINQQGIHMRPAQKLAELMNQFKSNVTLVVSGEAVEGKSMMRIMRAKIGYGVYVKLIIDGPDEEEALEEAVKLIRSGFDEI